MYCLKYVITKVTEKRLFLVLHNRFKKLKISGIIYMYTIIF